MCCLTYASQIPNLISYVEVRKVINNNNKTDPSFFAKVGKKVVQHSISSQNPSWMQNVGCLLIE